MKILCALILLFSAATSAVYSADKNLFDISRDMSADDQAQTGVSELTPEQLENLNSWMRDYLGQKEEKDRVERRKRRERFFGFFDREDKIKEIAEEETVDHIESRIVGTFYGWTGSTVFALENGMVWKQRHSGSYAVKMENPEVIIRRSGGAYWLEIKGRKARIGVKRVR